MNVQEKGKAAEKQILLRLTMFDKIREIVKDDILETTTAIRSYRYDQIHAILYDKE